MSIAAVEERRNKSTKYHSGIFDYFYDLALLFLIATFFYIAMPSDLAAETRTDVVYTDISGPELQKLLQKWGYRAELDVDNTGDPKIKSGVSGANFSVYFYDCDDRTPKRCSSISPSAAFDLTDGLTPGYINEWNRTKRFGKAYTDDEGDPFLNMNINIEGGISEEGIRGFFRWWETGLSGYLDYIGWR